MELEEKRKVLKERAIKYAKEIEEDTSLEEVIEVLEFTMANETYGIETAHIEVVHPLKEVVPVPCLPSHIIGVINRRGRIYSVLDLKKIFNLPEDKNSSQNRVIILTSQEMEFGILADKIIGPKFFPKKIIQKTLPTLTDVRAKYLQGVTDTRTVLLDARKLLTDKNLVIYDEI